MKFICYPKCTTCKKAQNQLDSKGIEYSSRNIKEENPTYEELKEWYEKIRFAAEKIFQHQRNDIPFDESERQA